MDRLSPARVDELLARASDVRALVVGDVMLDRYISGTVERVSPEAPVPVVHVDRERHAVGGAGNVALGVVALGAGCQLVGCVGDDREGAVIHEELRGSGVAADGVLVASGRVTTVKTRVLGGHQQIVRFDRESTTEVEAPLAEAMAASVRERAGACGVIVVQDYDKGALAPAVIREVLAASSRTRVPTVVDPKKRAFFSYRGATVLKPNARELEDALSEPIEPDDAAWMERARARLGCEHLLVTLGPSGMSLLEEGAQLLRLPAAAGGVFDVSGAGDTVTAVTAVAIAAGAEPWEAAILANVAAGIEVTKPGVQSVTPSEIRARLTSSEEVHPQADRWRSARHE